MKGETFGIIIIVLCFVALFVYTAFQIFYLGPMITPPTTQHTVSTSTVPFQPTVQQWSCPANGCASE